MLRLGSKRKPSSGTTGAFWCIFPFSNFGFFRYPVFLTHCHVFVVCCLLFCQLKFLFSRLGASESVKQMHIIHFAVDKLQKIKQLMSHSSKSVTFIERNFNKTQINAHMQKQLAKQQKTAHTKDNDMPNTLYLDI